MLYFAYGSNLNLQQMRWRCPRAEPVGKLYLPDTRLVFRGVCDVVFEEGQTCPGGLWRITADCEERLDRYEGYDAHRPDLGMYSKELVEADHLPDGETEVMLYTMNSTGIYPPSQGYFEGVERGYRDFGLRLTPLRLALKHAHDAKHPSYIERQRTRRMGRPALAPRPVAKATVAKAPKATAKATRPDPWGVQVPADKRRRLSNLSDWLDDYRRNGRAC